MNIKTRVSVVIPVYNEVDQIADCLQALQRQSLRPFEVIVVDNNSDDGTVAIASRFDFVTVLCESRQGVVHARDRGFNAARGDIIARIDADTVVSEDWVSTLIELFTDSTLDAVTGSVTFREIAAPRMVARIDLFWRRRMARLLGREVALQGANMAIRRHVWNSVVNDLCRHSGIHEDFDIAIHATQAGYSVRFEECLQASVCYRQADYDLKSFSQYALISPRTYLAHGLRSGRHMYQVVWFVIALYPVISIMSRGYDPNLGRFSLVRLFTTALPPRVNPATFVD